MHIRPLLVCAKNQLEEGMDASRSSDKMVASTVEYLNLKEYGIVWNEGERSIPQIWSIYPPRRFVHYALLSLYEFAAANFTKGLDVLDFGCGVGYGSYRLGVRGANSVYGIELDEVAVRFGLDHFRYPNVLIESLNINDLASDPSNWGRFDFVYCSNVMEHIEDYVQVIKSIHLLLKPGGMYFHVTPPSGKANGNRFHVTNYTIPEWKLILEPFFPSQRYFAHVPRRAREDVISEYEFDFPECAPHEMGKLKSISGIILAEK
jgi:2-polyprenyl-3-methyl-5-hydroxy-6-metoxy-1,4-benzoquinol methylase